MTDLLYFPRRIHFIEWLMLNFWIKFVEFLDQIRWIWASSYDIVVVSCSFLVCNTFMASLLCWEGIKSQTGAIKCCKETKITPPPNEWRNIPFRRPLVVTNRRSYFTLKSKLNFINFRNLKIFRTEVPNVNLSEDFLKLVQFF